MMNRLRKVAGVLVSAAPLALVSAPSHAGGGGIDVSAVTTAIAGASAPIAAIGAAVLHTDESWNDWLARADAALYRAKAGGRNRVVSSG